MTNERKKLVKILFIYILLLIIDGLIRNYMFSRILPESFQPISNVVNGFSLFFSTIWMAIIIFLSITFTFLYTAIFNNTYDYNKLLKAWSDLITIDIIIGVGKFSLLWILLYDEIANLPVNQITTKEFAELSYTVNCKRMDLIAIFASNIAFATSLYLSSKKDGLFSIILSILLLVIMLSLYYKII